jgi:LuxR family maltose regulon positive regulatory protein
MKEAQGMLDGALKLLDESERLYFRSPVPLVRPIAALKARLWIRQGRLAEALGWAQRRELSGDDQLSYLREFEHITLARLLIARYASDRAENIFHEAVGLLERLLKAAEEGGRMGSAIEILLLQSLAYQAQGRTAHALVPLERALTLARPQGYVQVFVNEGLPMAELLTRMGASRSANVGRKPVLSKIEGTKEYIHKLLAAFDKQKDVSVFDPAHDDRSPLQPGSEPSQEQILSPQPLIEPLSQRELEVLQLIAQGLSNREISQRLFLALNTIKGHNRKIFGKLQVQRRTEAVARARELGLL